jgi:hypothetical protein
VSTRHIPYASEFEMDYAAAHQEERRRRAIKSLEVGDVLAEVDDLIAQEPDPSKHPCAALAAWLLDRQQTPLDGGQLYDAWKALCLNAIDRLIAQRLQGED